MGDISLDTQILSLNRVQGPLQGDFLEPPEVNSGRALELDSVLSRHCCLLSSCVSSDLDWAVFEPDLLVTSSVDTYIYIWDIK